jgi:NitT/TauT family transport system substrate-binding protein
MLAARVAPNRYGRTSMQMTQTRRHFLTSTSLAAAAGILGARASLADEPPPEVTTVRLAKQLGTCIAPQSISEEILRAEGFTDVRYMKTPPAPAKLIGLGEVDFGLSMAPSIIIHQDAGLPVMALAGVHPGCWELFAHPPVRTISDLKGKKVDIPDGLGSSGHLYVAILAAHVGLDPQRDINWVTSLDMEPFARGEVDAFLASSPDPEELRARNVGKVILNSTTDAPWSHYFCCMLAGNAEYVQKYPTATKRVLRAIIKAAEMCAAEPEQVAQRLIDGGFTTNYEYSLQSLKNLPYRTWREYDPEDSLRFYALRLHEVGMITSSPNQLIAEGTDWRFLNELKRELKA